MKIITYIAEWPTWDHVVVLRQGGVEIKGIIEIRIFKDGERKGEAYLWNLHVRGDRRRWGYGKELLREAIKIAKERGCKKVSLDWDITETPRWVRDWYEREGFEEREFGSDYVFMEKKL